MKIKLRKLPEKLENQFPKEMQLIRRFYFSQENTKESTDEQRN